MSDLVTSFPINETDDGNLLLSQLGSFWYILFQDKDILKTHYTGYGELQGQIYLDYLETILGFNRYNTPIFHTERWKLIKIRKSAINSGAANPTVYGSTFSNVYGQDNLIYGKPSLTINYKTAIDEDIKVIKHLANNILSPSIVWTSGVNFVIEDGFLLLTDNPFDNLDRYSYINILDETGQIEDQEVYLWAYNSSIDEEIPYYKHGYVFNIRGNSSQLYLDAINAIWDSYNTGGAYSALRVLLSVMINIPIVIESQEIVKDIVETQNNLYIITNYHSYKYPNSATAIVEIGDIVNAGDSLVDSIKFIELNNVEVEEYTDLPMLQIDSGFVNGNFYAPIGFRNEDIVVDYSTDDSGRLVAKFELSGLPSDVDKFWDNVHTKGLAQGITFAQYLGGRTEASEVDPVQSRLPETINPMEFMINNIFSNNMFLVIIKLVNSDLVQEIATFNFKLRSILPPHTALITVILTEVSDDSVDLISDADDSTIDSFAGPNAEIEVYTDVSESIDFEIIFPDIE